jgi:hypothetical protein
VCVVHSVRRQHKKFLMRALVSSLPTAQEVARQQLYRVCVERTVLFYCDYTRQQSASGIYCADKLWVWMHSSAPNNYGSYSPPFSVRAKLIGTASTSCCAVCEFEILFLDVSAPRACMRAKISSALIRKFHTLLRRLERAHLHGSQIFIFYGWFLFWFQCANSFKCCEIWF